jgi:beta-glucosidase
VDLDPAPLFPFGHGLSYTRFDYSDLRLSAAAIDPGGSLDVRVDVRNGGSRAGKETVQLYLRDLVSSVSTPVLQLRGFRKVALDPGASVTVTFTLTPADLSLYDEGLKRVVEPGEFEVMIGASAADTRLSRRFEVRSP